MIDVTTLAAAGILAKPAIEITKQISSAITGYAKPWQIRRIAKAESDAMVYSEMAKIAVSDLQVRALTRAACEETRKQETMEDIIVGMLPLLQDKQDREPLDPDWIINFFEKCRNYTDSDMKNLWSRILAGEWNREGSFSRKTINVIGDLDRRDANAFSNLCRFCIEFEDVQLIYDPDKINLYEQFGINFDLVLHLESIGLIQYGQLGMAIAGVPDTTTFQYGSKRITVQLTEKAKSTLPIGEALLTRVGRELYRVCEPTEVPGFIDELLGSWVNSAKILPNPEILEIPRA
jgi:hypothetical protein